MSSLATIAGGLDKFGTASVKAVNFYISVERPELLDFDGI